MSEIQDTVMTADTARKILSVVDQGLCAGLGEPIPGQMCVEAAVCYALGLPHSDNPKCVDPIDPALRALVIGLNDSGWSSPKARAEGMRKLAVAQLGSLGQIDSIKFVQKLAEQTIRRLLPPILRQIGLHDAADRCEQEGTEEAARHAADVSLVAYAARYADSAARYTAYAAADAVASARDAARRPAYAARDTARCAARCATYAAYAYAAAARCDTRYATRCVADAARCAACDGVLTLMCGICVDILREMKAPGIALMDQAC